MYSDTLYTLLSTASAVSAIVGTRIYPVKSDTSASVPCIVYAVTSVDHHNNMTGTDATGRARVSYELTLITKTYAQAQSLAAAVTAAVANATTLSGIVEDRAEYYDDEVYYVIIEISVTP